MAKVSVVMPVYNTPDEVLKEAVESILNQTYKDFELLVINNGSCSDIKTVIDKYSDNRIKYYEIKENHGVAAARNLGIEKMSGEYYAVMDSDDIASPDRLEKQVQIFEAEPDVLLCASWFKRFPEGVVVKAPLKPGLLDFLKRDFLGHSTVMIRIGNKKEFLYKEEYEVCDDIELYSRLIMKGRFYVIPEALVNYRFEGKGISIKKSNKVSECAKKIKNQQMEFLTSDKKLQKKIINLLVSDTKIEKSFMERIFSIKNIAVFNYMYKIVTVLNIEFKFRKGSL